MQLSFLGAAGTVTGSKYLLSVHNINILIDCGLFQGNKELTERNWASLSTDPSMIDAVIITHAHLDHSGYLPVLVKNGYSGPIYATPGTKELCAILLADSGYLQEQEALHTNQHLLPNQPEALPLYTIEEAALAMNQFVAVEFNQPFNLGEACSFRFVSTAHILGAACVYLQCADKTFLFSGDLGRMYDPIMRAPQAIEAADYLIIESTYGDRVHGLMDPQTQLAEIINATAERHGTVVIPAFALGRAQSILYAIGQLKAQKRIADVPVFLDSPMAETITNLYTRYIEEHRLGPEYCQKLTTIATYIHTVDESKKIDDPRKAAIIISASGMANGGRVMHHIKAFAEHERNTILFTGFQAPGTLGAEITVGAKKVKIHDKEVVIRAQVSMIASLSAHADSHEILQWISPMSKAPQQVFITHGSPEASLALKQKITQQLTWPCLIPHHLQTVSLD